MFGCFFVTGLTGLVYEVVWTRLLVLAFGGTQFSVTTVLATFMGGLALGSAVFGRVADRQSSRLRVFALLEIALGVYCVATPTIIAFAKRLYVGTLEPADLVDASFSVTQFLIAGVAIVVPAALMGGTLPLLARELSERASLGVVIGRLYAVNTLGAVVGCVLAGTVPIHHLGVAPTLYLAGAVDVAVGGVVWWLAGATGGAREKPAEPKPKRKKRKSSKKRARREAEERRFGRVMLGALASSGFVALGLEVLWFRVLSLVLGASTYAFTLMLATFLTGIGLGSLIYERYLAGLRPAGLWYARLQMVVGASVLLGVFAFPRLPLWFRALYDQYGENYGAFMAMQGLLCAGLMLVPTVALGAAFPLAMASQTANSARGKSIGNGYAANTAGAIVGALVAGFVLSPLLGAQSGIVALAGTALALAAVVGWTVPGLEKNRRSLNGVAVAACATLIPVLPEWDPWWMTTGPYVNAGTVDDYESWLQGERPNELVFYEEGHNAVISVRRARDGSWTSYRANGKQEAFAAPGSSSVRTWSLLGHLPSLLSDDHSHGLLVGLGAGITLGAMDDYPFERLDVVELEPAVVRAAGFFVDTHGDALANERVQVFEADGRTFLAATDRTYDVIVSGVSDPWVSGVSNLFTVEYFTQLREHLAPGGVAAIWIQNYRIETPELKTMLASVAEAFPYISLWHDGNSIADLFVLASTAPTTVDGQRVQERVNQPSRRSALASFGLRTPFDLFRLFLAGDEDLRTYVQGAPLNYDGHPRLEFTLPFHQFRTIDERGGKRIEDLLLQTSSIHPPIADLPDAERAIFYLHLGETLAPLRPRIPQARRAFEKALELDPSLDAARQQLKALGG